MDRNLGASQAATSSTDAASYGDLYQWGRAADKHQKRESNLTYIKSTSDEPGNTNFIIPPEYPYDWRYLSNWELWQGENGVNNPCPIGYRIPTIAEWEEEIKSWENEDANGAFMSVLKLPKAGQRITGNEEYSNEIGFIIEAGINGFYWSSSTSSNSSFSYIISFDDDDVRWGHHIWESSTYRSNGSSVRCIKEE